MLLFSQEFFCLFGILGKAVPPMNDISLKQLEVFVAVVEYGGFTRAAEELFFNQSTISAHISLLEQALGKELFVRSNRRHVRLTADGEQVYPIAKRILGDCDTLRTLFASEKAGQTLSLGASTVPGQYLLPDYLSNFLKKEKDFRYSLRRGDSAQVHQMLKDGEISLGFVGAISEPNTVDYYPLAEDKLVLVTPNTPYYRQLQESGTYGRDLLSRPIRSISWRVWTIPRPSSAWSSVGSAFPSSRRSPWSRRSQAARCLPLRWTAARSSAISTSSRCAVAASRARSRSSSTF